MSRSIELGRAVLCSPAANLELWLTTLITISPQQDETNIQHLKPAQLLDFLSSGNVWVRRGHGMHIELLLTLREEPLPHRQLQDLVEGILGAPVWEQLMLQPSLSNASVLEPGLVRLNISYATDGGPQEEHPRHRVFPNVPAADVRAPNGVSTVDLQSVHFRMDILETIQRPKAITRKPKAPARESEAAQPDTTQNRGEPAVPNANLRDNNRVAKTSYTSYDLAIVGLPMERKRKRSVANTSIRTSSSPTCGSSYPRDRLRRPTTTSDVQSSALSLLTASDRGEIEGVIDGALRLSVCGSFNNRSRLGLKVKASTFALGLADIAPALWRPGYLPALSQRARMLPTISRSLSQVAGVRAMSLSLRNKMSMLTITSHERPGRIPTPTHQNLDAEPEVERLTPYVASRLWLHIQKNVTSKSATTLQPFVSSSSKMADHSDSDEMLEDLRKDQKDSPKRKSSPEDDEDVGVLDDKPMLREVWSSTEMERVQPREYATEHGSGETGGNLLLDLGHMEFEPTIASLGQTGFVSSHSGLEESFSNLTDSSNESAKQEIGCTIDSNWTVEQLLSTTGLQSMPVILGAGQARDDLLFGECERPLGNSTQALGSISGTGHKLA